MGEAPAILLIEDELRLRNNLQILLEGEGYKVTTACNGAEGIAKAKAESYDLVITDLVMPQMSGREVVERLRANAPGVRVICASGFVRNGSEEDETYLQKPFTSQDLLRKVKQAFN